MRNHPLYRLVLDIIIITSGCVITGAGLLVFLVPNKIAAGGASGLATIIYHLWGFPVGTMVLLINIPLFIFGLILWGWQEGWRTLYASIILGVSLEIMAPYLYPLTTDPLLATLYGGVVCGVGMGLVFRHRGTTGGTDLAARIINHFTGLSVGQGLIMVDIVIVVVAGIFFGAELALYAAIAIFVAGRVIDAIQEGLGIAKAALIITGKREQIRENIISRLGRGITIMQATGGYTGQYTNVVICVISRAEVSRLKNIVAETDSEAFVIITGVSEVLGEGFKENWSKN